MVYINKSNQVSLNSHDLCIYVKDASGLKNYNLPLKLRTWSTVKDVKDQIRHYFDIPSSRQRILLSSIITNYCELPNHRMLHDAGIFRNGDTLLLDIRRYSQTTPFSGDTSFNDLNILSSCWNVTPHDLRYLILRAKRGLSLGLKPKPSLDGSGGSYFLADSRKLFVGVFKPSDEEAYAYNNPRGYLRSSLDDNSCMRTGMPPGEGCLREVAAYLLDHINFCNVPPTTLVEVRHPMFHQEGYGSRASVGNHVLERYLDNCRFPSRKIGSFQAYIKSECTTDDLSHSLLPIEEVHKIAMLDIRLLNADRNSSNLLCRRNIEFTSPDDEWELVPIDHGHCLRASGDVAWYDWCWLDWPQTKERLSRKNHDYLSTINVGEDLIMLRERLHMPKVACDYYLACCVMLQTGVKLGMNLYDIAVLCCRNDDTGDLPSRLEIIMSISEEIAHFTVQNGSWHSTAACEALEHFLFKKKHMMKQKKYTAKLNTCAIVITITPKKIYRSTGLGYSGNGRRPFRKLIAVEKEDYKKVAADYIFIVEQLRHYTRNFLQGPSRQRSISITSSESSSFSNSQVNSVSLLPSSCHPIGFWHVAPGKGKKENETGEFRWSTQNSLPKIPVTGSRIDRYNSYSDVYYSTLSLTTDSTFASPLSSIDDAEDLYRLYYLKYINILVDREILL